MLTKTSVTHPSIRKAIFNASLKAIKTGISQPVFSTKGKALMTIRFREGCCEAYAGNRRITDIAAFAVSKMGYSELRG